MATIRADSREWLKVKVTAEDVDLDTQPVFIGITAAGVTTWHTAAWTGVAGRSRTARILIGPGGAPSVGVLVPGSYKVLVKITDNPEAPAVDAFTLSIAAA